MLDNYNEKLAKLAINYSLEVKKGDRIVIMGPALAQDLFLALQTEILKAGGHPLIIPELEGEQELFFQYASDEQLGYFDDIYLTMAREFDGLVQIFADYNPKKLTLVDPKKMGIMRGTAKRFEMQRIMNERELKGEVNWVIVPYPCHSYAQEANMDLFSYIDFVRKALLLDREDPVKEWQTIQQKQASIVDFLNQVKIVHVLGEDTNLTISVDGRKWINGSGQNNLPDGEVYTGPVENMTEGYVRFTYPGIYQGKEIQDIHLEFKKGKVTKGTAEKGQELLDQILKIRNANKLGEFAIGTNYGIQKFTKNMLFDEKIGGTMHCALGLGIPETGSKNLSTIHWDILKDMKIPGSKVFADEML
ncbi:MAG: aminopeptidase, partial [Candidatus Lokiarchaeota archaeon]